MEKELQRIREEAFHALEQAVDAGAVNDLRVKILGKKGDLTAALRGMGAVAASARPRIGQLVNDLRTEFEDALATRHESLKQEELSRKLEAEKVDITLPGRTRELGRRHPLTLAMDRIKDVFQRMGFDIEEGPEVESDYYNFEALNLPPDHPARDMQDSFYITEQFLLRTHTSPMQVRTMQSKSPNTPIRMIAPGKVYRRDYDATHSPMFQQVEGLVVGPDIRFSDLKGTLELFCQGIFGDSVKVRFRPSYFPFTEPSAEVDISCVKRSNQAFLCGLFSMVDAMLDRPMADILKELPLEDDIVTALLRGENDLGQLSRMWLHYEKAEWDEFSSAAQALGIEEKDVPELYRQALSWAQGLFVLLT